MKKRRTFSREFKNEAVRLVTEQGYTVSRSAESLEVNPNLLRRWPDRFQSQRTTPFQAKGVYPRPTRRCGKKTAVCGWSGKSRLKLAGEVKSPTLLSTMPRSCATTSLGRDVPGQAPRKALKPTVPAVSFWGRSGMMQVIW
jgi:transposase-like protein